MHDMRITDLTVENLIEIVSQTQRINTFTYEDDLYVEDAKQRKLYLDSEIDRSLIHGIARNILQYNSQDKNVSVEDRKPIILYITSYGGDIDTGLALLDVIKNSVTPVYTVCLGYWYSMALPIGICGHRRYAFPHSTFMIHDGTVQISGSGSKTKDLMRFIEREGNCVEQIITSHTKITHEEYDNKSKDEWYLFADEAKELGIIDYIIGEDCGMEEIA